MTHADAQRLYIVTWVLQALRVFVQRTTVACARRSSVRVNSVISKRDTNKRRPLRPPQGAQCLLVRAQSLALPLDPLSHPRLS